MSPHVRVCCTVGVAAAGQASKRHREETQEKEGREAYAGCEYDGRPPERVPVAQSGYASFCPLHKYKKRETCASEDGGVSDFGARDTTARQSTPHIFLPLRFLHIHMYMYLWGAVVVAAPVA